MTTSGRSRPNPLQCGASSRVQVGSEGGNDGCRSHLVAVLIAIAAGWLVWVEFHCRRNRARQITGGTAEGVDGVTAYPEQVRKGRS